MKEISKPRKEMLDALWWKMCGWHMSDNIPPEEIDVSKPFVYDRELGFFYVGMGGHVGAMTMLQMFHDDCAETFGYDIYEYTESKKIDIFDMADLYLSKEGRCYKSGASLNGIIYAGHKGSLNFMEKQLFKNCKIEYILDLLEN